MKDKKTKSHFVKSLRAEISLLILILGIIPGAIVAGLFFKFYQDRAIDNDLVAMTSQAQVLNNEIITTGYLNDTSIEKVNTQLNALGSTFSGRVMIVDSSLKVIKDTYDIYEGRTIVWYKIIQSLNGRHTRTYDRDSHSVILTSPLKSAGEDSSIVGVILITKSTAHIEQNISFYRKLVYFTILVLAIVMLITAVFASSAMTAPINRIIDTLKKTDTDLNVKPLEVNDTKETMELSAEFNRVFDSLKRIDDSRQEFVSNVSHELKTPLTSMKVLADSINSMGDQAPVEIYRDFMGDITHEIDRETKIINDLLSLVRMDKTGAALTISKVNVNEMLEGLLRQLKPIAESQEVELKLESFRPVIVEADEVKFSLAIMNLIENGIKYNNPGGYVHVTLNSDHQYCYIRVEDSGMGIPEDSLDRIFERFYRVDKSHSREIGGTGLGLAITKSAVDMLHGQINVHSELGVGTTFDVRMPLTFIVAEGENVVMKTAADTEDEKK